MALIVGNNKKNKLPGTAGNDVILGLGGNDVLLGKGGNDVMKGGAGNDILEGGTGKDKLFGGNGNDLLTGGDGADRLNGGDGFDVADYSKSPTAVFVSLATLLSNGAGGFLPLAADGSNSASGHAQGDVLISIEGLIGSANGDDLIGGNGANGIAGGAGADEIFGLAGNDILIGGEGNDTFFYLNATDSLVGSGRRDIIADFVQGQDKINLSVIDAHLNQAGDQAFNFIGTAAVGSKALPDVRFDVIDLPGVDGDRTIIQGEFGGDNDTDIDFEIELLGLVNLSASDFVL